MNDVVVVSVAMMFLCSFVGREGGIEGREREKEWEGEESSSRVMTLAPTTRNEQLGRPPFAPAAATAVNNVL